MHGAHARVSIRLDASTARVHGTRCTDAPNQVKDFDRTHHVIDVILIGNSKYMKPDFEMSNITRFAKINWPTKNMLYFSTDVV